MIKLNVCRQKYTKLISHAINDSIKIVVRIYRDLGMVGGHLNYKQCAFFTVMAILIIWKQHNAWSVGF